MQEKSAKFLIAGGLYQDLITSDLVVSYYENNGMLEERCPMWTPRSQFPLVYMESTQQKQYVFAIGGYASS